VTKWVRGVHHEQGCYFALFSVASGAISPQIYRITLSPFHIPLPSFDQIVKFLRTYIQKYLPDSLQYQREAYRLLADTNNSSSSSSSSSLFIILMTKRRKMQSPENCCEKTQVSLVIQNGKMTWFGHAEHRDDDDWQ